MYVDETPGKISPSCCDALCELPTCLFDEEAEAYEKACSECDHETDVFQRMSNAAGMNAMFLYFVHHSYYAHLSIHLIVM